MDEEKGGGSISARVPSPFPSSAAPPPIASSSSHTAASASQRRRFTVELSYGETTIVSWKRLVREAKLNGEPAAPSGAHPALESRIAPSAAAHPTESEQKDAQAAPNRFSAVIEKIERLYTGKESSDEEEACDIPDDDQYDTEDSFIDDSELNEYFEVEKQATKHNGFFVNRGALEKIEPSSSAPSLTPKKRRRKDSIKGDDSMNELVNAGSVRLKAAARNASLVGQKSSSPSRKSISFVEHVHQSKIMKNKMTASVGMYRKKSIDPTIRADDARPYAKLQSKNLSGSSFDDQEVLNPHQSGPTRSFGVLANTASLMSSREKGSNNRAEPHSRLNKENEIEAPHKIRRTEKNGSEMMLPDLNSTGDLYSLQRVKSSFVKEGSGIVRPKGTTLERAIRDLEKIVSACRPPKMDMQEFDASLQVKKRLPQEVKQKLAKVARLAASQGKIKEEDLLDRLMGIVGHLVQRKTLKRNLKEMVELGLSAKQIKTDRFQQIKKEVTEMIRAQIMHSKIKVPEQHDSFSDDFQESAGNEEKRMPKARLSSSMDDAIEEKICDLYELYVEGMDEDKGPQMRKLYVELAELWPNGYMDNVGIKDAIYRAKERRKALYRQQDRDEERMKRKKLAAAAAAAVTSGLHAQPYGLVDPTEQPFPLTGKMPPGPALVFPNGAANHLQPKSSNPESRKLDGAALLKRKLKRKLDPAEAAESAPATFREKLSASGPSLAP